MIDRRWLLGAAGAALAGPALGQQTFPARAVTIVVPYPPGGSVDLVARALAEPMTRDLGQPIVIDNRGGSAGAVAALSVAVADPDGYRAVLGTQQTHGTDEAIYPALGYRTIDSFAPICGLCIIPHALVVRHDLDAAGAGDLVALLKREPGKLNYGSTGVGSSSHLAAELFKIRAGVSAQHVPYRGGAPLAQDLMAGVVDFAFIAVANILGQIQSGAVRALAVASARRVAVLPDVPTLTEAGVADVDADAWFALFAPAHTPDERIAALARAAHRALDDANVLATLRRNAVLPRWRDTAEMPGFLATEVRKWAEVVRAAGLSGKL